MNSVRSKANLRSTLVWTILYQYMCSIYIFTYFHSLCLWTIFFFSLHYCISVVVCLIIFDNSTLLKLVRFFCCCWFFSFNLVYTFRLIFGSDFISISENFSVCPIFPKDKEEEKNNERMNIAFFNKCQHHFSDQLYFYFLSKFFCGDKIINWVFRMPKKCQ